MEKKKRISTIDEYIASAPTEAREQLRLLRKAILEAAPESKEIISYNMPGFKFHGMLVYMAAHTEHVGFYPLSSAIFHFKDQLARYYTLRGTVRFPYGKKIPVALVKRMVKFRMNENLEKQWRREQNKRGRVTRRK